jgi:hypothetical protein
LSLKTKASPRSGGTRGTLACADDDALGQELEVFWGYEPDRWILEEERWADLAAGGLDEPRLFGVPEHTLRWGP